ncbi:hypothetical protein FA09DRAFT_172158 [Tilletiopsis washingtonensis]|uniref:Uncharacterized protein n=1 Tax=Tilletiopsis washingtonensis TaxID=58919 RepID=A0A316Z399_9BASI|nr:hypothetical protein FA09DRAFT_172158 [Tilletiopsis washingtonensis]PWN94663.1 hypothetical protein FA09DRAFT_172158 [Tilletiopsis washingtonensis]
MAREALIRLSSSGELSRKSAQHRAAPSPSMRRGVGTGTRRGSSSAVACMALLRARGWMQHPARASGARGLAESRAAARRGRPALIDRPSIRSSSAARSQHQLAGSFRRARLMPRSGRKPLLAPGRSNARAKGPC